MDNNFMKQRKFVINKIKKVDNGWNLYPVDDPSLPIFISNKYYSGKMPPFFRWPWEKIQVEVLFWGDFISLLKMNDKLVFNVGEEDYPDELKQSISYLANWREDFFYFRDMGLDIYSIADIETKLDSQYWSSSPYIGDYMTVYDVIDPNSRKQIPVTMTYGIAPLLVDHYMNNAAAPIAGEFNNFVITNAVDDTLRFTPRITPSIDQKTIIDDLRVNYANYSSNGLLTVQSTYTSQDHWGPLSYSSNVIITQMCIKDIRRYTPKIRFMLMGQNTDFTKYKQLIEDNVISSYRTFFKDIKLQYTRDDEMIVAKIFNASLYCWYQDFPQGEIFDVFAIEGSPDTNNPLEGTAGTTTRVSAVTNTPDNVL